MAVQEVNDAHNTCHPLNQLALYGYVEPGYTTSVTEAEYDHACKRGLECLCCFLADGVPWTEDRIERSAVPQLEAFKERIQSERMTRWFRDANNAEDYELLVGWVNTKD